MPTGDALLSGYYLNELLLTLLARDDPHPVLFDIYAQVTAVMASGHGELLQTALRAFELLLLCEIGLLPLLDAQTMTLGGLEPDARYSLVPEGGLRQTAATDRANKRRPATQTRSSDQQQQAAVTNSSVRNQRPAAATSSSNQQQQRPATVTSSSDQQQ